MRNPISSILQLCARAAATAFGVAAIAALSGCGPTVQVAPITIEPITITVDINIKIDKELDNFFAYQKGGPSAPATAAATATAPAAATAPATTP